MCVVLLSQSTHVHLPMSPGLLDDIFRVGSLVPRVAGHVEQPDYLTDVEEIEELSDQRDDLLQRVSNAITQVHVYVHACRCKHTTSRR